MKRITLLLIAMLLSLSASADERQFYFLAKEARLGSISNDAKNEQGIYLRWDLIEGTLPSDIHTITLQRIDDDTNTTLLDVNAHSYMPENNISTVFQEVGSQRRLFEAIDFISNNDAQDENNCTNANISNIASKVTACLNSNYWGFLASRVNFNIAQARYRAYLDTSYDRSKSQIEYILLAHNSDRTKNFILGRASVNREYSTTVLEAADFKQITTSKCNDNRYGLDDFKIALYWKNGGENATEFYANGLMISGYDLYYSISPEKFVDPGKIDIAQLASNLPHNAKGDIDLSSYGLAKVNDTLITLGEKDANSSKPIFIQSEADLYQQGFKVGEERYYFLVPKDFTGNYGPTVYTKVNVPDLLPPPKPLNPRVIEENGTAVLLWNAVNFSNFASYYKNDMKTCSTDTIASSSRVRFIDSAQSCSQKNGIVMNFNVSKYIVYRFESAAEAAAFEDLDLDGYNDANESASELCKKSILPGLTNYAVYDVANSNTKSIRFRDTDVELGKVYWYRIISVTNSGVSSQSTAPIRAFIPKRELLDAPDVNVTYTEIFIDTKANEPQESNLIAIDKLEEVTKLLIVHGNTNYEIPFDAAHKAYLSDELKDKLFQSQNGSLKVIFMAEDKALYTVYINSINFFSFETIQETVLVSGDPESEKDNLVYKEITLGYKITDTKKYLLLQSKKRTLVPGTIVRNGCIELTFTQEFVDTYRGKGCIETNMAMGHGRYKRSSDCTISRTKRICEESLNGDLISIGIRLVLDNGFYSQTTHTSHSTGGGTAASSTQGGGEDGSLPKPNKPSLIAINVSADDNNISVSFRPQIEKVAGTMFTLYKKNNVTQEFTQTMMHIGRNNPLELLYANFTNIGTVENSDTWCVKAKTIGINSELSVWSSPLCQTLTTDANMEKILTWPALNNITEQQSNFSIALNPLTQEVEIELQSKSITPTNELAYSIEESEYSYVIAEDLVGSDIIGLLVVFETGEEVAIAKDNGKFILELSDMPEHIQDVKQVYLKFHTEKEQVFETIILTQEMTSLDDRPLFKVAKTSNNPEDQELLLISQKVFIDRMSIDEKCTLINHSNNFVVYRQSLYDTEPASNFVQVSPLITEATCLKSGYIMKSNNLKIKNEGLNRIVSFVDKYPYVVGEEYRYILLYFNTLNAEPVSYTTTSPETIQVD